MRYCFGRTLSFRASGTDQLCGGDRLAYVALGVIGDVNEQTGYRSGEISPADGARLFQVGGVLAKSLDALGTCGQRGLQLGEELIARRMWIGFSAECRELFKFEWVALGVGQQAVDAAGDMTELKGDRGKIRWVGVKLLFGKLATPGLKVFRGKLNRVDNRARRGGNIRVGTAKPRLCF
jgi:hypothetical protein